MIYVLIYIIGKFPDSPLPRGGPDGRPAAANADADAGDERTLGVRRPRARSGAPHPSLRGVGALGLARVREVPGRWLVATVTDARSCCSTKRYGDVYC